MNCPEYTHHENYTSMKMLLKYNATGCTIIFPLRRTSLFTALNHHW